MRQLLSLALCSGILLVSASAQAHSLPVRPHVASKMEFKAPAIVLANGSALPSMPTLPECKPVFIDYVNLDNEEHKVEWPREAVKPELEYDATPLLAPPDSIG